MKSCKTPFLGFLHTFFLPASESPFAHCAARVLCNGRSRPGHLPGSSGVVPAAIRRRALTAFCAPLCAPAHGLFSVFAIFTMVLYHAPRHLSSGRFPLLPFGVIQAIINRLSSTIVKFLQSLPVSPNIKRKWGSPISGRALCILPQAEAITSLFFTKYSTPE